MRLIYKNQIFITAHPKFSTSFTLHLKSLINDAMIGRFERFQELTAPFDEGNLEEVLQGLCKLCDMINDEISNDNEYFRKPFMKYVILFDINREFDVVRLTTNIYLKNVCKIIESKCGFFSLDSTVKTLSSVVFALYKKVCDLERTHDKICGGYLQFFII